MKSLSQLAGIDIEWKDDNLQFGDGLIVDETFSRPLGRLKSVALDPSACTPEDRIQYWMYNGIAPAADRDQLARTGMRYELTLMYPRAIGQECAKTLGHLHSFPAGLLDYFSLYQTEWTYLMAACVVFVLPVMGLFFLAQRLFVEGISFSGLKG